MKWYEDPLAPEITMTDLELLNWYLKNGDRASKRMIKAHQKSPLCYQRERIDRCKFLHAVSHGDKDVINALSKFLDEYKTDYEIENMKTVLVRLANGEQSDFIAQLPAELKLELNENPLIDFIDNAKSTLDLYNEWKPISDEETINTAYERYRGKGLDKYKDFPRSLETVQRYIEDKRLYDNYENEILDYRKHNPFIIEFLKANTSKNLSALREMIRNDREEGIKEINRRLEEINKAEFYIKQMKLHKPDYEKLSGFKELEETYKDFSDRKPTTDRMFAQVKVTTETIDIETIKEEECRGFSILVVYDNIDKPFFFYLFFSIENELLFKRANDNAIAEAVRSFISDLSIEPFAVIISDIHGDIDKVIIANGIRNLLSTQIPVIINGDISISKDAKSVNAKINPLKKQPYTRQENDFLVLMEIKKLNNCILIYGNHDDELRADKVLNFLFHYIIERSKFTLYISHSFIKNYSKIKNWKDDYSIDDFVRDYGELPTYYFPQNNWTPSFRNKKQDFDFKKESLDYIDEQVRKAHKNKPVFMVFGHSYQFLYLDNILTKIPTIKGKYLFYEEKAAPFELLKNNVRSGKYQASDSFESGKHMLYGGKEKAFTLLLAIILLIVLVIVCVYVCKRFEIFDYKSEPPI